MKLSISKNKFEKKPTNKMGYKDIPMRTIDIKNSVDDLMYYFTQGYAVSGIYKDSEFVREGHYTKDNYVASDFLIVDVDNEDYNGYDWIDLLDPKPTLWTTTFSANGNNCRCHIFYSLSETLYGSDAYTALWNDITKDYPFKADIQARSPKRLTFTTNPSLPFFRCGWIGGTLDVTPYKDIVKVDMEHAPRQYKQRENVKVKIDEGFLADFNTMDRKDFLNRYVGIIKYTRETKVDFGGELFVDMRGKDFYQLKDKVTWENGTPRKKIIKIGHRNNTIFDDARQLLSANKNMTIEELIYAVTLEIDYYYDNSDGELTKDYIVSKLTDIYSEYLMGKVWGTKTKRKFKCNNLLYKELYPEKQPLERVHETNKAMTDKDLSKVIDTSLTIEQNMKLIKEKGLKTTKPRVEEYLERKNIHLDKNIDRIKKILKEEGEGLSIRKKVQLCKKRGYPIGKDKVRELMKESVPKNEFCTYINNNNTINNNIERENNIVQNSNVGTPIDAFTLMSQAIPIDELSTA